MFDDRVMVMVRPLVINSMPHDHHFTVYYNLNILNGSFQKLFNVMTNRYLISFLG